ncbi:MAG: hypothetical protein AB7I18_14685 [Candidatus Berkiella sp.]
MARTIREDFDNLMKQFPQASYQKYEELLDLAQKFGDNVVRQKLQAKPENKPQPAKNEVLDLINEGLRLHDKNINRAVNDLYKAAEKRFEQEHANRARPALELEDRPANKAANKAQQKLKADWIKNSADGDPKIRDAAIRQAIDNIRKDPQSFTEQFKNVVRAEAEYRLALKMRNAPKPGKKIEPRPY